MLTGGVCLIAASGSVSGIGLRAALIVGAVGLIGLTFRLDRRAANNLFPPDALSLAAPIGLALWILAFHGMTQTSASLFLPLLLQVVHGVSPVVINFLNISSRSVGRSARSPCPAGRDRASAPLSWPGRRSPSRLTRS